MNRNSFLLLLNNYFLNNSVVVLNQQKRDVGFTVKILFILTCSDFDWRCSTCLCNLHRITLATAATRFFVCLTICTASVFPKVKHFIFTGLCIIYTKLFWQTSCQNVFVRKTGLFCLNIHTASLFPRVNQGDFYRIFFFYIYFKHLYFLQ